MDCGSKKKVKKELDTLFFDLFFCPSDDAIFMSYPKKLYLPQKTTAI